MSNVPCNNPSVCGVQTHRDIANCKANNRSGASISQSSSAVSSPISASSGGNAYDISKNNVKLDFERLGFEVKEESYGDIDVFRVSKDGREYLTAAELYTEDIIFKNDGSHAKGDERYSLEDEEEESPHFHEIKNGRVYLNSPGLAPSPKARELNDTIPVKELDERAEDVFWYL